MEYYYGILWNNNYGKISVKLNGNSLRQIVYILFTEM